MKIFIDLGNSFAKFALKNENKAHFLFRLKTQSVVDPSFEIKSFNLFEFNKLDVKEILICSVRNAKENQILEFKLKSIFKNAKIDFFIHKSQSLVKFCQKELTSEIGLDIVANAYYVLHKSKNAIFISLGTAIVITQIKNSSIEGISIYPGIYQSFKNFFNVVAKIESNFNIIKIPPILGKTTLESISSSLVHGSVFLLKGYIDEIDKTSDIFITGGDYHFLKDFLEKEKIFDYKYVDNMVIEALNLFDQNSSKESNDE